MVDAINSLHRSPGGARIHWLMQRFSALILIPLIGYGCLCVPWSGSIDAIREALALHKVAISLGVGTLLVIMHAVLGLQVVIEDYMPRTWHKPLIYALKIWGWFLTLLVVWSLGGRDLMALWEDMLR